MTQDQIDYLLESWQYYTLSEMSKATGIFASQLSLFFKRRQITLLSKYEIIGNRIKRDELHVQYTPNQIAEKFGTNHRIILRVLSRLGLKAISARGKSNGDFEKLEPEKLKTFEDKLASKIESKRIKSIIEKNKKYYEEHKPTKIVRPPTIYNQYGSPILDELRGYTTTLRK